MGKASKMKSVFSMALVPAVCSRLMKTASATITLEPMVSDRIKSRHEKTRLFVPGTF